MIMLKKNSLYNRKLLTHNKVQGNDTIYRRTQNYAKRTHNTTEKIT